MAAPRGAGKNVSVYLLQDDLPARRNYFLDIMAVGEQDFGGDEVSAQGDFVWLNRRAMVPQEA
jgi:hypothetical protein